MATRRDFLRQTGMTILGGLAAPSLVLPAATSKPTKPDYKLSIQPCEIEIVTRFGIVISNCTWTTGSCI